VSFDATKQVWAMRRAHRLPGGTTLLVLLGLADHANRHSGEVSTSLRYLAAELGVHYSQVSRALAVGRERGAIDLVQASRGRARSVYRFQLARPEGNADEPTARPISNAELSTVLPEGNANGSVALQVARPTSNSARPRSNATDALEQQIPVTRSLTRPPGARAAVETPAAAALALMVGVETHLEEMRGTSRRPGAVAATIERRLAGSFGARLAGMVAEGLSPERAAAAVLVEDGVGGVCPHEGCRATDARPITDAAKCAHRHSCPFYVGVAGAGGEVLL
jgi:hypothetical protein